jgi:hypothetical protein
MNILLLMVVAAVVGLHILRLRFMSSLPRETSAQQRFTVGMTFGVGAFNLLAGLLMAVASRGLIQLLGLGLAVFGIYAVRDAVLKARVLRASSGAPSDAGDA